MGLIQRIKNLMKCNWGQLKENIYYLMEVDLRTQIPDLIYQIKDETIEECVLEFEEYKNTMKRLQVLDAEQTIHLLMNYPKSFSRYGDGEIHIMQGKDQAFQKYDPELARKMLDILRTRRDDVYVGLNHAYWESPNNYAERNRKFYRMRGTSYRRFFTEHCDPDGLYLDAACFGAYYRFDDSYDYEGHYARIKALFAGKKIAIVAGEGVFEKLQYNVFEEAEDQLIVHGPRIHAFSEYDTLIENIKQSVPKDYLVCAILGQTATALVVDLTDLGYMAWDVGHVAKDYDAYMNQTERTQKNMDAFWAPD